MLKLTITPEKFIELTENIRTEFSTELCNNKLIFDDFEDWAYIDDIEHLANKNNLKYKIKGKMISVFFCK